MGFLCAGTRLQQALEAAHAAANAQSYMAIAPSGGIATFETTGNPDGFVVLQAPVAGELLFSRPTAVLLDCGTDLSRRLSARNSVTEGPARGCGTVIGFAAEGLGRARWIDDLVQTLQVLPPAVVRGGLNAVDLL